MASTNGLATLELKIQSFYLVEEIVMLHNRLILKSFSKINKMIII